MQEEIIVEGKSVEEAVEQGLSQLGLSREQVDVEVVDEAKARLFGLMGKAAKVRLRSLEGPLERALRVVRDILQRMGLEAQAEGTMEEGQVKIEVTGAGGVLIGRRGETLSALQYLVNRICNQDRDSWDRITLDVESYRARREKKMTEMAERLYRKVLDTGKAVTVKNLSAHDRRIVHMTLKDRNQVETHSHGTGRLRKLIVAPRGGKRGGERRERDSGGGASNRVRTFTKRFESPFPS